MAIFISHISLVGAGLLMMISGVGIARFLRHNRQWLQWHRTAGIAVAISLVAGLIAALIMVAQSADGHLKVPHAWLGLTTVLLGIVTPTVGFLQFKIRSQVRQLRLWHRRLGYVTLALGLLSVLSGLVAAGIINLPVAR